MSVGASAPSAGSSEFVRCEVLYFIQNKSALLPFDSVVTICADFYTNSKVVQARALLAEHFASEINLKARCVEIFGHLAPARRITKHSGTEDAKRKRTIHDLVKLCLDQTVQMPTFFSVDMSRIPSVGLQHVDISMLLQEVSALRAEVHSMTQVCNEIADIRLVLGVTRPREDNAADDNCASADASSSSYAATARQLQHSGMKDKPASKTKKPSQPPVVGRAANSKLKTVVTMRDIDLFVSRLHHPVTHISELHDCVTEILGERFANKAECFKLKSRYEELYSSYHVKVRVNVSDFANALEMLNVADSWPEGALIRRYFKPKNGEQ